jgi:hypothetical protein
MADPKERMPRDAQPAAMFSHRFHTNNMSTGIKKKKTQDTSSDICRFAQLHKLAQSCAE